jgi:hypothetical protein
METTKTTKSKKPVDYLKKLGINVPSGASMVILTNGEKFYFGNNEVIPQKIKDHELICVYDHFGIIENITKLKNTQVNISLPGSPPFTLKDGKIKASKKKPL